jgi:hypothetical protein
MRSSLLRALCTGRIQQTCEGRNLALDELRKLPPRVPFPEAATLGQASLESDFLEAIGRCDIDRWQPYLLPYVISSVTPRPHELVVRIPGEYLPDVIRAIMPHWLDGDGEVYGIPGLRASSGRDAVALHRPGRSGQLTIPCPPGRWRRAVGVAADMLAHDPKLRLPWTERRRDWDSAEIGHVEFWPRRYSPTRWQYRHTRFASQIMRRLPGLCSGRRPYYHNLWLNRFGDSCSIEFEWATGPPITSVLGKLLDPVFGPGAEIALLDGQTFDDCYAEGTYRVNVRSAQQPGCWISLRHAAQDRQATDPGLLATFGEARRFCRAEAETRHGY